MFLYLGDPKSARSSKHRAPTVMFLYLGSQKRTDQMHAVLRSGLFSRPVTGPLGRPASVLEVGFFHWASNLLVVCVCMAASFFLRSWFFQGLLGRPAALLKVGLFHWASSLLAVCVWLSLACLVGLLLFVKWIFPSGF